MNNSVSGSYPNDNRKTYQEAKIIMPEALPPVDKIPSLSTEERAAILDKLFEPCNALHTLSVSLLHEETFSSYYDLIADIGVQLTDLAESASTSDTAWLEKILGAHPRLGEKKVDSEQSRAEQAQLNTGGEEEASQLRSLNEEYEKTFPGLRYVYVQRYGRVLILGMLNDAVCSSTDAVDQLSWMI